MTSSVHAEHPLLDQPSVFTRLTVLHKAKGQNRVAFAVTFLKDITVFCQQQYQQKVKVETDAFIT